MMTDPLSPEDRALHEAFFAAARAKFKELAAAADGGEVSIDACQVHAIKAMVDREIERRYFEIIPPNGGPRIVEVAGKKSRTHIAPPVEMPPIVEARIVEAVGVGVRVRLPEDGE